MNLLDDIAYIRTRLEEFARINAPHMGVASVDGSGGVPPEMFDGEFDGEGWVAWKMLPSTLTEHDVAHLENELSVEFPPMFRAYLLAGFHLFDQVHCARYDQLNMNTHVPSDNPLGPIRSLIDAWNPLLPAGYLPFGVWGDGWGPMCFDMENRRDDRDCPVVWMDHELLIPLGPEECGNRDSVLPHVNPLYGSYREFFDDASFLA